MVQIALRRADLKPAWRKYIQECVKIIYEQTFEKATDKKDDAKGSTAARGHEFATCLKTSLDRKFEPHWHVIMGENLGFACKKRNGTMGMFMLNGKTMVIVFKSPGIEPLSDIPPPKEEREEEKEETGEAETKEEKQEEEEEKTQGEDAEKRSTKKLEGKKKTGSPVREVRVSEPQARSAQTDISTNVPKILQILRETADKDLDGDDPATADSQKFAQALRSRLSYALDPIWHIVTGSRFVAEVAENREDYVRASIGKTEVLIFRHKQIEGSTIDFGRILAAVPYLLLCLFLVSFLLQQYICDKQDESQTGPGAGAYVSLQRRLCGESGDNVMYAFAAVALCCLCTKSVIARSGKRF